MFPYGREVSNTDLEEFRGITFHAGGSRSFSQSPTVTHITGHSEGRMPHRHYLADELEIFTSYVERMASVGKIDQHSARVVG